MDKHMQYRIIYVKCEEKKKHRYTYVNNFICQSKARQKCPGGGRVGMTLNCFPPETKYFPFILCNFNKRNEK